MYRKRTQQKLFSRFSRSTLRSSLTKAVASAKTQSTTCLPILSFFFFFFFLRGALYGGMQLNMVGGHQLQRVSN